MKPGEQSQANNPHPKQASNIQVNQSHLSTEYNIKVYIGLIIIFILFISIIFSIKSNVSASNQSPSNTNLDITNSHRNICPTNPMAPELNSNGVVIDGNNNSNNNKLYSSQIAQTASALNKININHIISCVVLHSAVLLNVNVHIKLITINPKAHEVAILLNQPLFIVFMHYQTRTLLNKICTFISLYIDSILLRKNANKLRAANTNVSFLHLANDENNETYLLIFKVICLSLFVAIGLLLSIRYYLLRAVNFNSIFICVYGKFRFSKSLKSLDEKPENESNSGGVALFIYGSYLLVNNVFMIGINI